jgi:predicted enzyme related to lactoylglutathione lyase
MIVLGAGAAELGLPWVPDRWRSPAYKARGPSEVHGFEGRMENMEVLGSRILLHPSDPERSHRFYRDTLGLAIYREFGSREAPGLVFFLGNGFLEVSGRSTDPQGSALAIWMQVRDVQLEHDRLLTAGVPVIRKPQQEMWDRGPRRSPHRAR